MHNFAMPNHRLVDEHIRGSHSSEDNFIQLANPFMLRHLHPLSAPSHLISSTGRNDPSARAVGASNQAEDKTRKYGFTSRQIGHGTRYILNLVKARSVGEILIELNELAKSRLNRNIFSDKFTPIWKDPNGSEWIRVLSSGQYSCVPLVANSNNKKFREQVYVAQKNESSLPDCSIVLICAALKRLHCGFPVGYQGSSTANDPGDIFQGNSSRVAIDLTLRTGPTGLIIQDFFELPGKTSERCFMAAT